MVSHGVNSRNNASNAVVDMKDHNGLRGIAAVWIVIFHCLYYDKHPINLLGSTLMPLFFLLSGFSLAVAYTPRFITEYRSSNVKSPEDQNITNVDEMEGKNEAVNASQGLLSSDIVERQGRIQESNVPVPKTEMSTGYFLFNRFLRTMPVYYITFLAAIPPLLAGYGNVDPKNTSGLSAAFILNILPINTWFGELLGPPINGPSWTVCTLWFFWIFFPVTLRHFNKKSNKELMSSIMFYFNLQIAIGIILFLIFVIIIPPASFFISTWWPPSRIPIFFMGICGGLLCLRDPSGNMQWFAESGQFFPIRGWCCCCAGNIPIESKTPEAFSTASFLQASSLLIITVIVFAGDTVSRYVTNGGDIGGNLWLQFLNPYAQLCFLVAVTKSGGCGSVSRVLRNKFILWLGDLSMSIYLTHFVLIYYLEWALHGGPIAWPSEFDCNNKYSDDDSLLGNCNDNVNHWNNARSLPDWGVFVILPASILFSAALFYGVEEPIRKYFK